ncbi:MAG TPA: ParB N-terminal domain-containing protein [Alphaproteobacteria bacterium]|jgi:ParB-like chromosome segregation protein Spo0J|nr:ParB N-terminal domain-containing protein [Alphaproteobacteria bacterium]MDP6269418.1 ParB N-terminal domain-containing protein [Alphaproteobacteria bacterium]MDP7427583.1 ParB N-terminal domain-containing protein [Alphaproteobacteria bacterium]HJM51980.1 ParB N-terminal domain-containing protein [Alphaproteobacteria bacterium]|tara:strand:+ start:291 stop:545 length:255 start_codon:yes stop_codon:yes gene_type:complete
MLETVELKPEEIYVPVKLRKALDADAVEARAESYMEEGSQRPIQVRHDRERKRWVLVAGINRLEALKALGEETIEAMVVDARQH